MEWVKLLVMLGCGWQFGSALAKRDPVSGVFALVVWAYITLGPTICEVVK